VLASLVSNPTAFQAHFAAIPIVDRDLVATRYFSPKITDVSGLSEPGKLNYGFRKVIRLKARPGSTAASSANIDAIWVLFNYFVQEDALATVPLQQGKSVNIQLIATRKPRKEPAAGDPPPPPPTGFPLYWMVFDAAKNGAHPLIAHLNATFDARDPELVNNSPNTIKEYFVPAACAQCHGGKNTGKLNFLDTDHWIQRILADSTLPGNDFPKYVGSPHGVLVEGGKDETAADYKKAFADIRLLNQEIETQNATVSPTAFQTKAVKHWNFLHATNDKFLKPGDRGVPDSNTGTKWDPANQDDRQLIEVLDRYCYRCHSSVKYNVYEKAKVIGNKQDILDLIDPSITSLEDRMPQDRTLTPEEIKLITDLVNKLPSP
jgi:hypothetical protein